MFRSRGSKKIQRIQAPAIITAQQDTSKITTLEQEVLSLKAQLQASTLRLQILEEEKTARDRDLETAREIIQDLQSQQVDFVQRVYAEVNNHWHGIHNSAQYLQRDLSDLKQALTHHHTSTNIDESRQDIMDLIHKMREYVNIVEECSRDQTPTTQTSTPSILPQFQLRRTQSENTMPLHSATPTPTIQAQPIPYVPLNQDCVLVVDDSLLNQKLAIKALTNVGYQCDAAENGEIAFKKWQTAIDQNRPYCAIIMDVQMPIWNGLEATCAIRNYESKHILPVAHTPIIGLSGNREDTDVQKALDAGMDKYLTKPFGVTDLPHIIRSLILSETTTSDSSPDLHGHRGLSAMDVGNNTPDLTLRRKHPFS